MSKAPFFISAPRTRSSVLFETAQFYVENVLNKKSLHNHTELFLEFSRNTEFYDLKTDERNIAELYPVVKNNVLDVHYIFPHVFDTRKERNLYKLKLLQEQKDKGYEYNIKGTVQIIDTVPEIIEFYNDRHFVLTKRRNIEDYVCSFLVAYITKFFHARHYNIDRYNTRINEKVYVDNNILSNIHKLLDQTRELWKLEEYIKQKGYSYTVTYYEDLDTQDKIDSCLTDILGTSVWKDHLPVDFKDRLPIKIDKVYSNIISNYDEIIPVIRQKIKDSGLA